MSEYFNDDLNVIKWHYTGEPIHKVVVRGKEIVDLNVNDDWRVDSVETNNRSDYITIYLRPKY